MRSAGFGLIILKQKNIMPGMALASRSVLLLALGHGPGFGLELIERVGSLTDGRLRVNRGGAYLALRRLVREGLVRTWLRRIGRRGRPRRYYELTSEGILALGDLRRAIGPLLRAEPARATPDQLRQMADRVNDGAGLSAFVMELRRAGRRAGLS